MGEEDIPAESDAADPLAAAFVAAGDRTPPARTRKRPRRAQYEEDLVHIAVPARYLPHITQLLLELDQQARPLPKPERKPAAPPAKQPANWPVEELRSFSRGRTLTHRTIFGILDVLAERPDTRIKVADVAAAAQVPLEKVIGALAGLTRLVKSRHDYAALGPPLDRIATPSPDKGMEVFLSLTSEQASRWKSVRFG